MERRAFIVAAVSGAAGRPLGRHIGRVLHNQAQSSRGRRSSARVPRGVLVMVCLAGANAGWRPTSWRDVPPAPFEISQTIDAGLSLAACRSAAKRHNQEQLRLGVRSWLVVIATDGRRRARGGAA